MYLKPSWYRGEATPGMTAVASAVTAIPVRPAGLLPPRHHPVSGALHPGPASTPSPTMSPPATPRPAQNLTGIVFLTGAPVVGAGGL